MVFSFEEIMKRASEVSEPEPVEQEEETSSVDASFDRIMGNVLSESPAPQPVDVSPALQPVDTSPSDIDVAFDKIMSNISDPAGPPMTEFSQPSDPELPVIESNMKSF